MESTSVSCLLHQNKFGCRGKLLENILVVENIFCRKMQNLALETPILRKLRCKGDILNTRHLFCRNVGILSAIFSVILVRKLQILALPTPLYGK